MPHRLAGSPRPARGRLSGENTGIRDKHSGAFKLFTLTECRDSESFSHKFERVHLAPLAAGQSHMAFWRFPLGLIDWSAAMLSTGRHGECRDDPWKDRAICDRPAAVARDFFFGQPCRRRVPLKFL